MYLEKTEERLAVMFILQKYEAPLNVTKLYEIMTWEKQVMEYFELSETIMELSEDKYIEKTFYRNSEAYVLTPKGKEALDLFSAKIPPVAKARISDAVDKIKFDTIIDPNLVEAEVYSLGTTENLVRFRISENGKDKIELMLNFGPEKLSANLSAEHLKKNATEVYKKILDICMPDEIGGKGYKNE